MAKRKTIRQEIRELKESIEERTRQEAEHWLRHQIEVTAQTKHVIDLVFEALDSSDMMSIVVGSTGQSKTEVNPLLDKYKQLCGLYNEQLTNCGLNYGSTPSKITENTKQGGTDTDLLSEALRISQE